MDAYNIYIYDIIIESTEGTTFLDEMYSYIERNQHIAGIKVESLMQYIYDNQFDSDAVRQDLDGSLENGNMSNIYNIIKNKQCIDLIFSYMTYIECMFFLFIYLLYITF